MSDNGAFWESDVIEDRITRRVQRARRPAQTQGHESPRRRARGVVWSLPLRRPIDNEKASLVRGNGLPNG
jgi:hypothetical protein